MFYKSKKVWLFGAGEENAGLASEIISVNGP
jgi:hypothetical protein